LARVGDNFDKTSQPSFPLPEFGERIKWRLVGLGESLPETGEAAGKIWPRLFEPVPHFGESAGLAGNVGGILVDGAFNRVDVMSLIWDYEVWKFMMYLLTFWIL
jgi:hypothetical protein